MADRHEPPDAVTVGSLWHLLKDLVTSGVHLMAIAQAILDAQAKLDADVTALAAKVDALLAAGAGGMTPAEQQSVADAITAADTAVQAILAK